MLDDSFIYRIKTFLIDEDDNSLSLMKLPIPFSSILNLSFSTISRQQRQQLTLEMASSACHDSLISACVGLPSYQESFAVDPNEILSKDRATRVSINNYKST